MTLMYLMLVGLPGSGKSHLVEQIKAICPTGNWQLVSSDRYIDSYAEDAGKTYDEVFQEAVKEATVLMNEDRQFALQCRYNIIHDQTNLTAKSRAKKLSGIPAEYVKIAIWCSVEETVRQERLIRRPGKIIPEHVDKQMRNSVEQPMLSEGFNAVVAAEIWESVVRRYV